MFKAHIIKAIFFKWAIIYKNVVNNKLLKNRS